MCRNLLTIQPIDITIKSTEQMFVVIVFIERGSV